MLVQTEGGRRASGELQIPQRGFGGQRISLDPYWLLFGLIGISINRVFFKDYRMYMALRGEALQF